MSPRSVPVLLAVALLAGCGDGDDEPASEATTTAGAPKQPGPAAAAGQPRTAIANGIARSGPLALRAAGPIQGVMPVTSSGQRRDRIRLVIPVELASRSAKPIPIRRAIALVVGARRILPDTAPAGRPGVIDLRDDIDIGVRRGQLRFELGGADTLLLRRLREGRLEVRAPGSEPGGLTVRVLIPSEGPPSQ